MFGYRLLLSLAMPVAILAFLPRLLRGREPLSSLAQRCGYAPESGSDPVLWVHGASVGELNAARRLLSDLLDRHPDLRIIATTNTMTGQATITNWGLDRLTACLAPIDLRLSLGLFLRRVRPIGLLLLENELWPNRMTLLKRRGLPVAMISARLSATSCRRWTSLASGLARRMLSGVSYLSAQTDESAERFLSLGLAASARAPSVMLKQSVTLPAPDPLVLSQFAQWFPRDRTILAASTHDGEEAAIIEGFQAAMARQAGLRLIMAPRHPERGDAVSGQLSAAGLPHARRSRNQFPLPDHVVYLADTMGEMSLWYALAGVCLVGGSLVPKGGHTPWEPAQFSCAILHGPHLSNFADAYRTLDGKGAALLVTDAESLTATLTALTWEKAQQMGERGRVALAPDTDHAPYLDLLHGLERTFGLLARNS